MNKKGSLVNVGLGMTLGSHITPLSRSYIEKADVVFVAASDSLVEDWVKTMNKDVRSLQGYYKEGMSRMITYRNVINAIMTEVRAGKKVCGAFYGHPGVFSWAPHESIKQAQAEGYMAHMEPGISAEDCLYADTGIDPGKTGCCHYEATQFMCNKIKYESSAYLILWQISIAGDHNATEYATGSQQKQLLVDLLLKKYPTDHMVILYECAVLAIHKPRTESIQLKDLAQAQVNLKTTLIIPPAKKRKANYKIIKQLGI
jgi:precorrin-3B methylase